MADCATVPRRLGWRTYWGSEEQARHQHRGQDRRPSESHVPVPSIDRLTVGVSRVCASNSRQATVRPSLIHARRRTHQSTVETAFKGIVCEADTRRQHTHPTWGPDSCADRRLRLALKIDEKRARPATGIDPQSRSCRHPERPAGLDTSGLRCNRFGSRRCIYDEGQLRGPHERRRHDRSPRRGIESNRTGQRDTSDRSRDHRGGRRQTAPITTGIPRCRRRRRRPHLRRGSRCASGWDWRRNARPSG